MQRTSMPGQRAQLTPLSSGQAPWKASFPAVGLAAVRFNSSWSDPAATPAAETTTPGSPPPAFDDLSTLDISAIPEHIGYLKQLGLDYGWGPASMMEWFIEHIHIWTGLPWWASIVTVGILIRAALLKPMLDASDNGARLHNVKHLTAPIRAEMMSSMKAGGNSFEVQMKKAEINKIHADHGIATYKSFVPMLQLPLAFGMFRVIRGMGSLPVPGLANESVLWITDLTVADPLYVLPALTSLFLYFSLKVRWSNCPPIDPPLIMNIIAGRRGRNGRNDVWSRWQSAYDCPSDNFSGLHGVRSQRSPALFRVYWVLCRLSGIYGPFSRIPPLEWHGHSPESDGKCR